MMDHNPDLQDYKVQDPKLFRQAYDSLRRANPGYGSDPLISGAHMRKIMDTPEVAGLKDMAPSISMQTPRGGK